MAPWRRSEKVSAIGELRTDAQIELAGQRDVAVGRGAELPVHVQGVGKVLPAVAGTHVTYRGAAERN